MIKRLPIFATIIVIGAVGTMIALGLWQLQRAAWKAQLLEHYAVAADAAPVSWPLTRQQVEPSLYRRTTVLCGQVLGLEAVAGRNAKDQPGLAQSARCMIEGAGPVDVVLGWSEDPARPIWTGGVVSGIIAPGRGDAARLVADPPLAGLEANALPDPATIPNNHMSYAVQWFFFAATALLIYALALRKRLRGELADTHRAD